MNRIEGNIKSIVEGEGLRKITIQSNELTMHAIVLKDSASDLYIKPDAKVAFLFKETNVVIGKLNEDTISLDTNFNARITKITKGALLSQVDLSIDTQLISAIISTEKANLLELKEELTVTVMLNMNAILISAC